MPDRDGLTLSPGDPVLYVPDDETAVVGTVLRVTREGRYLFQIDPIGPCLLGPDNSVVPLPRTLPIVIATLDQHYAALAAAGADSVDPQEPFEVEGEHLTFIGNLEGDEDDEDEGPP